eukprot:6875055-Pyramimonas_sp.AAC.1
MSPSPSPSARVRAQDNLLSTVLDAAGSTAMYEFEKVYGPETKQIELYEFVKPVVRSAIDGFNGVVFAYGQTSAGKTYTMQ